jgi:predicted PurR-regulated permease PerM|tara:strand:- start:1424 stop:1684 length:261 start_codon:yes stop_codon:yes gene_type:complete
MILEILLVLVTLLFLTSCYVIWNINTKLESLEDWITDFINTIEKVQADIKKLDYKGYFESDDEVGVVFKQIQTTINQLDRFKGEEQ